MTFTTGLSLKPGLYFDSTGAERRCIIIFVNGKALLALDAITRERVPNPSECIPVQAE